MAAMGFSLNNLTLFGLVLAIGIVVDDAIVVLENTERMIAKGYDARTATIKAMEEITGPILAITLALCSVFVPCCFIGRDHGPVLSPVRGDDRRVDDHLGRQRPDHDAVAGRADFQDRGGEPWARVQARGVALVDLRRCWAGCSLSGTGRTSWPAGLACRRLSAGGGEAEAAGRCPGPSPLLYFVPGLRGRPAVGWLIIRPVNAVLGWLFRGFNRLFDGVTSVYGWTVGKLLRISVIVLVVYGGLLVLTYWTFQRAPTGFIPQQDQGRLIVNVQLPDSASLQRTKEAMALVEKIAREDAGRGAHGRHLGNVVSACRPTAPISARCSSSSTRSTSGRSPGLLRRRHHRPAAQRVPAAGQGCGGHACAIPRRSPAWASPAASRSWSRTAAAADWRTCKPRPTR